MKLIIVVIDDEECIRESLRLHLEDLGHEVITAPEPLACDIYNGDFCQKSGPCGHALITDYQMPRMNGLDFIEFLTKRGCKGITANMLVMSGNIHAVDRQKAMRLGCRVIPKPLSFDFIDGWLEEVQKNIAQSGSPPSFS